MSELLVVFLCVTAFSGIAQSKKDIKQYDIKAVTEEITRTDNGKEIVIRDSYIRFDKHGNTLEEIKYDKAGRVEEKIVSKYNSSDEKTEEIHFNTSGLQTSKEVYKYDELGEKSEELKYDSKDQLISRSLYKRDRRGLKTDKRTFNAKGNLIEIKKYNYDD